jgi:hypothetical protein
MKYKMLYIYQKNDVLKNYYFSDLIQFNLENYQKSK